jgi:hypothetical protein
MYPISFRVADPTTIRFVSASPAHTALRATFTTPQPSTALRSDFDAPAQQFVFAVLTARQADGSGNTAVARDGPAPKQVPLDPDADRPDPAGGEAGRVDGFPSACGGCAAGHRRGASVRPNWLHRVCQHWRIHMLRIALSAVALIGALATAQVAFADPPAATAPHHGLAATAATQQSGPPEPASSSSSSAPTPANAGLGKDSIPVGFGWG